MKRKESKPKFEIIEPEHTTEFKDKYDVIKDTIRVHSSIKQVKEDIVLAKSSSAGMSAKDHVYILESVHNAVICHNVIQEVIPNYQDYLKDNKLPPMDEFNQKRIKELANTVYSLFMDRINMIALLNRNVADNKLIENILGIGNLSDVDEPDPTQESAMTKAAKKLVKKRSEKDNE